GSYGTKPERSSPESTTLSRTETPPPLVFTWATRTCRRRRFGATAHRLQNTA
ncbi:hypothetical protein KI387_034954, partial [Taxus chinensis]